MKESTKGKVRELMAMIEDKNAMSNHKRERKWASGESLNAYLKLLKALNEKGKSFLKSMIAKDEISKSEYKRCKKYHKKQLKGINYVLEMVQEHPSGDLPIAVQKESTMILDDLERRTKAFQPPVRK